MFFAALGLALIVLVTIPSTITAQAADQTTAADRSPLVPITLYLQWYHQFQFAGYYAALEQGYYRDAGLDVSIIEGGPGVETFQEVASAPGRYGTAHGAGVLLQRIEGQPLVALAAIFQHSPNAIIARADRGITTPHHLPGTRTVIWPGGHVELSAMLLNEGIDPAPFLHEARGDNVKDLIAGKVDAIDGYVTNEAFSVRQAGIPVNIIRPDGYGVDFYGDTLITSERELRDHPERLDAFREASLRGWNFALDHPQEIVDLLIAEYAVKNTREHLLYEAEETKKLILSNLVEIGHMNPGRWAKMADTLVKHGMIDPGYSLQGFIYDPSAPKNLIVFLGDKNFAPYEFLEDGEPVGAGVDLWKALGSALGRPVEVRLYQWADAQSRFDNGEGHALTLMSISKKRKESYEFTQSTFRFEFALFVKNQHLDRFSLRDLSNKRIAVTRGGYPRTILENSHPEAEMVFVDNSLQGFQLLLEGDVDGVTEESLVGHYVLRQNNIQGIEALQTPLSKRTVHIPVIKGNSALLEEFNQAISELKSTGKIQEITRRWLGGPVLFITRGEKNAGLIGAAVTLAVVAILAILLFFVIAKWHRERTVVEGRMKASLAEKEVLLREIHHRVKNNLQVVSSMLSLQAGTGTDDRSLGALEEAQRRVKVMARIHENLHQSVDLASINARDYLNTVVADTIASSGHGTQDISFRLDADNIILHVDHAVVCGQIISELLSNALKHAFPNGQSGNVEVSLHRGDGGRIELTVADDGEGLPEEFDLEQTQTLGMRLVHALAMQLSGVVDVDGSGGTRVQIAFPENPS